MVLIDVLNLMYPLTMSLSMIVISPSNFYWMLDKHLLEPINLQGWYYWPFGTHDNLHLIEDRHRSSVKDFGHAIFFYDQEPIYKDTIGDLYDWKIGLWPWSDKMIKILPNSEHSAIKKKLCKNRNFQDWYFFYHGFVALDWFRDARFFDYEFGFDTVFCSFNHLVSGNRAYRLVLTSKLFENDLQDYGCISLHADKNIIINEINSLYSRLTEKDKVSIGKNLLHRVPLIIDSHKVDGKYSAHFGQEDYNLWKRSLFHIVNETIFYDEKLHLTEKIFKPIVCQRPFILVAAPGNLEYIRRYGFKTFDKWIDESYDLEKDAERRLDMINEEILKICSLPWNRLQEIFHDMTETLIYNKKHFFGNFKKTIVDELVDNFDQSLRVWNNGRVDDREVPLHPDLDRVKKILLS